MGGYGALKCGLRAPEVFSKVASLSGAVNMRMREVAPEAEGYWSDIFGDMKQFAGSFNDLMTAAEELKDSPVRPDVYMWCGTEDFLHEQNVAMRRQLNALGYNLVYEESPGDHQWKYWDAKIQTVLDWLVPGKEEA